MKINGRYTRQEIESAQFYQFPKFLMEGTYKDLPGDAKIAYMLLRDRHGLSVANGWVNDRDEVYIIFTRDELADMLGRSIPTTRKALEQLKAVGLINEERQGQNKPNLIYLCRPSGPQKESGQKKSFTPDRKNLSPIKTDNNKTENLKNVNNGSFPSEAEHEHSFKPEIMGFINWYRNYYYDWYGIHHPNLKAEQVKRIHDTLDSFCTDWLDSDPTGLEEMAESFFERVTSDHNLNHFATEGILEVRFYDSGIY